MIDCAKCFVTLPVKFFIPHKDWVGTDCSDISKKAFSRNTSKCIKCSRCPWLGAQEQLFSIAVCCILVMVSCIAVVPSPQSPPGPNTRGTSQFCLALAITDENQPTWCGPIASASV